MSVGELTPTDWAMHFAKPGDLVVVQTGPTVGMDVAKTLSDQMNDDPKLKSRGISVLVVAGEGVESVSIARSGEGPIRNEAIDLVREREDRAAKRCGADPDVWRAAHAVHHDRKNCLLTLDSGEARGFIIELSDTGVSLGSGFSYEWHRIRRVEAVGN